MIVKLLEEKVFIEEVNLYLVDVRVKRAFTISTGTIRNKRVLVVEMKSSGISGFGEIPALTEPIYNHEFIESAIGFSKIVFELIKGKEISISDLLEIHDRFRGNNFAKSGIEFALYHLVFQKLGKSIFDIIKPAKEKFRLQSSIGIGSLEEIGKYVEYAYEREIRAIKLKIKPGWTHKPVNFVRKEYNPEFISVDANGSFNPFNEEHWNELKELAPLVDEIEQPFKPKLIFMHGKFWNEIETPVSLDESVEKIEDLWEAAEIFPVVVNIKPPRVGGLTNALRLAQEIHKRGLHAFIGGMLETTWGRIQNMIVASQPSVCDVFPGDFSPASEFYEDDLGSPDFVVKDGFIHIVKDAPLEFKFNKDILLKATKVI